MRVRWFAWGALLGVLPQIAIAAGPPAAGPPQVWELDWQKNHCTISTGSATSVGFALWMTPGDPQPDLYLIGSPKALPALSATKLSITLMPSGRTFSAVADNLSENPSVRAMAAYRFSEELPAAFATSTEVRIGGLKAPVSIPVIGAGKAMVALRQQCIYEKLAEWGVDPKVYDELRVPPTNPPGGLWYTADDYPSEAMAAGEEGATIARMNVDVKGRVTSCDVVVSSGSTSLDAVTCKAALQRGHFNPAIGADGRPMAAFRILRVTWNFEG